MGSIIRRPALLATLVVVLAAVVSFEVFALLDRDPAFPAVSDDVTLVAHDFGVAVTSFDYRRIDADVERVLAFGDEDFVDSFRAAMGPDFATQVVENRRISVGEVVAGPTPQRALDGRTIFLVVLNQRVASAGEDGTPGAPETVRVSLLVTVTTQGEPRVSSVQVL